MIQYNCTAVIIINTSQEATKELRSVKHADCGTPTACVPPRHYLRPATTVFFDYQNITKTVNKNEHKIMHYNLKLLHFVICIFTRATLC